MPFDFDTGLPHTATAAVDPDAAWRDRLVDLHVLAEHGDQAAAAEARAWITADERAHRAWHEVEARCDQLRGTGAPHGNGRGSGVPGLRGVSSPG